MCGVRSTSPSSDAEADCALAPSGMNISRAAAQEAIVATDEARNCFVRVILSFLLCFIAPVCFLHPFV